MTLKELLKIKGIKHNAIERVLGIVDVSYKMKNDHFTKQDLELLLIKNVINKKDVIELLTK